MNLHFVDSHEVPLAPEEVRIRSVKAEPLADGKRIAFDLVITPFRESPDISILIQDEQLEEVASADVIGVRDPRMQLTLHVRGRAPVGALKATVELGYREQGQVDTKEVSFSLPTKPHHEGE
jgi:hypothetical protein